MPYKDKQKIRDYQKQYRDNHRENWKDYNKNYWVKNKEKLSVDNKLWHKKNPLANSIYNKKSYYKNREKVLTKCKTYYYKTIDKQKIRRKKYYEKNREEILLRGSLRRDPKKVNAYVKHKMKTDVIFRLKHVLRKRMCNALNNQKKMGSHVKDLGCSAQELRIYLEKQFKNGMNWENHSKYGWHVDHIIPLASFNLLNREEFLKAVHYTNLQPLWAKDNLSKGSKQKTTHLE